MSLPALPTFQERFGPIRWVMAPMAGITDMVFRTLIRELGAQMVVSELLSSEGLVRGGARTRDMLRFSEAERPVGIQIFGHEIRSLAEAAKIVQGEGADFVDINLGCPVKKVVCDGGGAAWLKDPVALGRMLSSVREGLRIPLTIKIRTGWDEGSRNAEEVVRVAYESGVSWVAIHGRTRAQGYAGSADWEYIREIALRSPIPILGNGDILEASQAVSRIENGYCHAVMIGRGALKNPWIFQELLGQESFGQTKKSGDFHHLIDRHFELALEHKGPERAYLSLKKFLAWYAAGFPGVSQFRAELFSTKDLDHLRDVADRFFRTLSARPQTDRAPFLMGGHG